MFYVYLYLLALVTVLLVCFILNVIYISYERFNQYMALQEVNIIQ